MSTGHRDYTLAEMIGWLDVLRNLPIGSSCKRLARITGLAKATVGRLLRDEPRLRQQWEEISASECCQGGRQRQYLGKDPEVDAALHEWYLQMLETMGGGRVDVPIGRGIFKSKAMALAKAMGHEEFRATAAWFMRFKKRYKIQATSRRRAASRAIEARKSNMPRTGWHVHSSTAGGQFGVDETQRQHPCFSGSGPTSTVTIDDGDVAPGSTTQNADHPKLQLQHPQLDSQDVYMLDAVAIRYPSPAVHVDEEQHQQHSPTRTTADEQRISVMTCANMSGSDKHKLLVVGRTLSHPCFRDLDINRLPVEYRANRNARITVTMFKEWLQTWDAILTWRSRKVLLIISPDCPNTGLDCLRNINIEVMPSNMSTDRRLAPQLKDMYQRRLQLEMMKGEVGAPATNGVVHDFSIIDIFNILSRCWRHDVDTRVIQQCFVSSETQHASGSSDVKKETSSCSPGEDVRDETPCFVKSSEDESNLGRETAPDDSIGDDQRDETLQNEESNSPNIRVSNAEARRHIRALRRYFMQKEVDECPQRELDLVEDLVYSQLSCNSINT